MPNKTIQCANRLPEWSNKCQSLVLKFHDKRIHEASSKNFLIYRDEVLQKANSVNSGIHFFLNIYIYAYFYLLSSLYCIISYYIVLYYYCLILYYIILYYIILLLYYIILYYITTVLYYITTVLYYIILYYIILYSILYDTISISISITLSVVPLKTADAIMQFGKVTSSRYVLDFKYPLSPIQAFGIALTAFVFGSQEMQTNNKLSS